MYKSIDDTSLEIIDDVKQLDKLLQKLKNVKEIAIDLEVGFPKGNLLF